MKRLFFAILLLVSVQLVSGVSLPFELQNESEQAFVQLEDNATFETVVLLKEFKVSNVQSFDILKTAKNDFAFKEEESYSKESVFIDLNQYRNKSNLYLKKQARKKRTRQKTFISASGKHKKTEFVFLC